jgi:hypothetical protein
MTLYWITDPTCPLCPAVEPEVRAFAQQHQATLHTLAVTPDTRADFEVPSLYLAERGWLTAGRFCVQAMQSWLEAA